MKLKSMSYVHLVGEEGKGEPVVKHLLAHA